MKKKKTLNAISAPSKTNKLLPFKVFLSALMLLLAFSTLQAQTITTCSPATSTPGSNLTVSLTGTNINFNSATSYAVELRAPNGTILSSNVPNIISNTALTADFSIPSNAQLGNYDIRVQSTVQTWAPGLFALIAGAPNSVGSVSGHIFYDENSNCTQDGLEPDKEGSTVMFLPGPYFAITDIDGNYFTQLLPNTYTVQPVLGIHDLGACPAGSLTVNVTTSSTTVTGQDFGIEPNKITDGGAYCNISPTRPGFDQYHDVVVQNNGYYPLTGTIEYVLDPAFTYLSSNPMATAVSGDTVRWDINPAIARQDFRNYSVTTNLPPSVPLATVLHCSTILTTDSVDANIEDNFSDCNETVVGSFDPNDKAVWNQDMVAADPFIQTTDSLLHYRIRFQNTGTASAINIFVRDTLDANVDASTFKTLGTSHSPVSISMNGDGNIEWRFDGINLADSNSNEPASHGYILYSVKIKDGFGTGATIKNKAAIYFDFNDPVITNETQTSFAVKITNPIEEDPVVVYPNPVKDMLFVKMDCKGPRNIHVAIMNTMGQIQREVSGKCVDGLIEVPVGDLAAGMYMVRATLGKEHFTKKILLVD